MPQGSTGCATVQTLRSAVGPGPRTQDLAGAHQLDLPDLYAGGLAPSWPHQGHCSHAPVSPSYTLRHQP